MVADEFQGGKSPVHNQAAYLKAQQIAQQNAAVQQQRQQAPSGLSADSPQYQQVKAAEAKAAQQAYVAGQFSQKGSSQDKYAGAREAALASGRFDYGTDHSSAFYSPPDTFINKQGQRVNRVSTQLQREAIYKGYLPASSTVSTAQQEAAKATLIYGPQVEYGGMGKFGPTTNPLLPSQTSPVTKVSEQTSYSMAPQFQTFTTIPQKETVIPPAKSTNPELRQAVLQTFVNDPSSLKYTGTDKGSYLYALAAKGVLAQEDFGFLNQLATSYNAKVEQQNIQARQANIKAELKSRQDITTNLQAAKAAGVTSVNILDAKGNVVGTVNPQNIPEARLQTLKLLSRSGGVGLSYSTTQTQEQQGVTSTQTIYTPSNVFTALVGGALGGFAEVGLIGLGLLAKLTGKEITVPGTTTTIKPTGILAQAETKVQQTFGQQTVDQLIAGQKVDLSNPIAIASLTGFAASLVATGGAGGVKAIGTAPLKIVEAIRSPSIARTIAEKELQEGITLSQLSRVKGSTSLFEFEQGVAGKSVASTKIEDIIKVERLPSGKVQATRPITPKEIKITPSEKEAQPEIPYAVISATGKGVTSIVTKGVTELTPQQIAIKGIPPEVAQQMGLKYVEGGGVSQVYKGALTSKNIPTLLEEIRVGNIKPSFDVMQFFTKDISQGAGRYGMMARSPGMLASNAFERVVRPSVLRVFESKVELEKEAVQAAKGAKPMRPIGPISEGLGGAGAAGRSQALTQEEKALVQTLTKSEQLAKPAGAAGSAIEQAAIRASLTGTTQITKGRTGLEEETIFIQTPKGLTKNVSLGQVKTDQRQEFINKVTEFTKPISKTETKQTSETSLITKTTPSFLTTPVSTTTTTTKQITVPLTTPKQVTIPTTTTPPPPTETPVDKKRIFGGGGALGVGGGPGMLGKVGKYGERKEFIGNVPTESIVGVYKRGEISYGKRASTQEAKEVSKASTGRFVGRRTGKLL